MTAKEALEIIVDLMAKAGSELRDHPGSSRGGHLARGLLGNIETIAISYDEMDSDLLDMVNDDRFEGTMTSSVRPSP